MTFSSTFRDGALEDGAFDALARDLDASRGCLLASSYEYPGRYTRWDVGFSNPPFVLTTRGLGVTAEALNKRGEVIVAMAAATLAAIPCFTITRNEAAVVQGVVHQGDITGIAEEDRTRIPSVFTVLRAVLAAIRDPDDDVLGLYGAFGYDLCFQVEPVRARLPRPEGQREVVLYLPDEVLLRDHARQRSFRRLYEFSYNGVSTADTPRTKAEPSSTSASGSSSSSSSSCDHSEGEYAALVRKAKEGFKVGDMFEVVPGQTFSETCATRPSDLFTELKRRNPAPFGFLFNLGEDDHLVGASPEMYVRVEAKTGRVETCPISGTIARGADAMGDELNIRELLNSAKEESELSMCTDVDRNDKSRVCEPGSVRVLGRRLIEKYSRLIHTVDHVEGYLRPPFDALDAFVCHMWAVTVTGAPKSRAVQFLEDNEKSARAWYAGAVGVLGVDGGINTGLTLRTIRVQRGVAHVRAGATLLFDSDPDAEERETRLKASAMLDVIRNPRPALPPQQQQNRYQLDQQTLQHRSLKILLVDFFDSFVHTLANYLRQTGATVVTLRSGSFKPEDALREHKPDVVVLSPGPGSPSEFGMSALIAAVLAHPPRAPRIFGVCLGLQGLVEHFGGTLGVLPTPVHGKPSPATILPAGKTSLFRGIGKDTIRVGRYHSLYADRATFPAELEVLAETEQDAVIMAIRHRTLRISAVQFHPESILSESGMAIIVNGVTDE
jgi:anthranilate synthase